MESAGHHHGAGVKWTNLHLRRVLQNPRLVAALRVHQGKVIGPGNWEPILDADTLHGITALLNDPSRKNAVAFERRHLLSGIAKCGICGSALYAQPPYSSVPVVGLLGLGDLPKLLCGGAGWVDRPVAHQRSFSFWMMSAASGWDSADGSQFSGSLPVFL